MNNRTARIVLCVLMFFWLFLIPQILYFVWVKPVRESFARNMIALLTCLPIIGTFAAIILLLIELNILNIASNDRKRK